MTAQFFFNADKLKAVKTEVPAQTFTPFPIQVADVAAQQYSILPYLNLNSGQATAIPDAPAKPSFTPTTLAQTNYFDHITKFTPLFIDAWNGIAALQGAFTQVDTGLQTRFDRYIADYFTGDLVIALFGKRPLINYFGFGDLAKLKFTPPTTPILYEENDATNNAGKESKESQAQRHLFFAGKTVVDHNRSAEQMRQGLYRIALDRARELGRLKDQLADLEQDIVKARIGLGALDRTRRESLDDYQVAQRLIRQHWGDLLQQLETRRKALENHRGLFYVRVRETPVERPLTRPESLVYTDADDIVPGCDSNDEQIPESLIPFMEAVLEIAATDWAVLKPLYPLLPSRNRLESMLRLRSLRINDRMQSAGTHLPTEFQSVFLAGQHLAVMRDLARQKVTQAVSLSDLQQQSHAVLSLEDLVSGPSQDLRQPAITLHGRLHQAASCLAERLRSVAPSIRRQWAEAADNGSLPVETPEYWPGLGQVESADFDNARTLVEVLRWWFRQLSADRSGTALAAMRNLIRAELLLAASEDPSHLLQGTVKTPPGVFQAGALLRLELNREAPPGTLLQLLNGQQVVGSVRVEDHDANGALAKVIQAQVTGIQVNTSFRVFGSTAKAMTNRS